MSGSELYFAMVSEYVNSCCCYFALASEPVDTLIFGGSEGTFTLNLKTFKIVLDKASTNLGQLTFIALTSYTLKRDNYKVHYDIELFLNLYDECKEQIWKQVSNIVKEFDRHFKIDHPNFMLPIEYLTVNFSFSEN